METLQRLGVAELVCEELKSSLQKLLQKLSPRTENSSLQPSKTLKQYEHENIQTEILPNYRLKLKP